MISMNKNRQRCLGLAALAVLAGACSVDTSDVHFVPDDLLDAASKAGKGSDTGNAGTGNTGADDAGGAPDSGGSTSTGGMGGTGNKAGSTGKAGAATTGGTNGTAGAVTGGNGPVGGMGGAMPMCGAVANRNEPLIDDFEDGNAGLPMPPLGGRAGGWYAVNDGSPAGTQIPPAMDPTRPPKPGAPGHDGKGFALYTSGKGFKEWGAGLGVSFSNVPGMTMPCVYDAAIHTGIRFWAMGKVTGPDPVLHFRVITTDVADREHAGLCDANTETCYDNFNYDVDLSFLGVGAWEQYVVRFADLKQGGWGTPKKFYPNHLLSLEFVTGPDADFEVAVDQVEFF